MFERSEKLKLAAGILMIGFVVISILSSENGNIFEAQVGQNLHNASTSAKCESLILTSQPSSPIPPYTNALIRVQTIPINFTGILTFSADSGIFDDLVGHRDSYIETKEKVVNYTGGEPGTVLTIEDKEGSNQNCSSILQISDQKPIICSSLTIKTSPNPLHQNQSAEIEIITTPADFRGTYLVQSDSGKFQPSTADIKTTGINTNILVTSSKFLIYNGGKKGEKITIQALDDNNSACKTALTIQ